MKISELHLLAYGPFTKRVLDLSRTGFQMVYGPNEGGKSSSLRAIEALLFGIPSKTNDDFVHRYADLRVGGTPVNGAGGELSFVRRKKIKGSLAALENEKVLPDNALDEFLCGLEQKRFRDIHCINHDLMRQGGRLLRTLKGLADDSLLVASSSANFPSMQNELRSSLDGLYAPRKSTSQLLTAKKAYSDAKDHRDSLKETVQQWQSLQADLRKLEQQKDEIVQKRIALDTEKRKLDRMRTALPKIAEWKRRNGELGEQPSTQLPTNYKVDDREYCEQQLNAATSRETEVSEELCELESVLHGIKASPKLLAIDQQIEALQQRIGTQLRISKQKAMRRVNWMWPNAT